MNVLTLTLGENTLLLMIDGCEAIFAADGMISRVTISFSASDKVGRPTLQQSSVVSSSMNLGADLYHSGYLRHTCPLEQRFTFQGNPLFLGMCACSKLRKRLKFT